MTRDDLLHAAQSNNARAFLALLANGESHPDLEEAYRALFGWRPGNGKVFDSFEDHPRVRTYEKADEFIHNGKLDYTTGAGRYQITESTWDPLAKRYGLNDFGPTNQDCAALALIAEKGALDDVLAGRVNEAIRKLVKVWASLPGASYGQPTQALSKALAVYEAHGGRIEAAAAVEAPVQSVPEVKRMGPLAIIPLVLEGLSALIPALGKLGFGSGSEVATRNIAAGAMVAEKLVQVTNAVNIQEAAEKIQNDPQALQAAKDAVAEVIGIVEAGGGGIKAAREQSTLSDGNWRKAFLNPAFVIGLLIVFLVAFVVVVIVLGLGSQTWSDEIKAMVVTAIVTGGLGSVLGFFLGSSLGSQRKDALLAAK